MCRSVPVCESMSRTKRVMVIVRPSVFWHKARIAYSSRVLILRGVCSGFNLMTANHHAQDESIPRFCFVS